MVFMHKQRFPKYSLLKMWYITAWRSYKTHRILDRWKMALQFDSSVYWSLTRHVCAKGVCQEVIKKGRWGEKSRIGLQQVLWWVQMWNFWIKWSVYTEVKEVRQLLQSSVKQGGGSILVQGCISASGVGSWQRTEQTETLRVNEAVLPQEDQIRQMELMLTLRRI